MKKLDRTALIFLMLLAMSLTTPVAAGEPVLVYQRIHSLVAHHDNRISLRVWADHRMEARFPAYTPRAGRYERQLSAEHLRELFAILDGLPDITQQQLNARLDQGRSAERVHVADADIVRFEYRNAGGEGIALAVPAPDVWSHLRRSDEALAALSATEQALRRWMDDALANVEEEQ